MATSCGTVRAILRLDVEGYAFQRLRRAGLESVGGGAWLFLKKIFEADPFGSKIGNKCLTRAFVEAAYERKKAKPLFFTGNFPHKTNDHL
ncbi:MAG: hypothetical protein Q8M58_05285 [Anaerolineales bacterium]|nr:hypothetical protein [Anaerolineales bacterium]